jgi:Berberine and berberine like
VLGRGLRQLPRVRRAINVCATLRVNYDRLVQVKQCHDPGNFFRLNQNIAPA